MRVCVCMCVHISQQQNGGETAQNGDAVYVPSGLELTHPMLPALLGGSGTRSEKQRAVCQPATPIGEGVVGETETTQLVPAWRSPSTHRREPSATRPTFVLDL